MRLKKLKMKTKELTKNGLFAHTALEKILQNINHLTSSENINLEKALGRILAQDILAPINVPNFANSAMDGYAIVFDKNINNTQDWQLNVVGKSFAGHPFCGNNLKVGECVRIMTGAVIPVGANVVVMQENVTKISESQILITKNVIEKINLGENIRPLGDDIKQNQVVLRAGRKLSAIELGVISSLGISTINVYKKVKVAIFSTGDELVPLANSLNELPVGFIFDSNRIIIKSLLWQMGFEVNDLGIIKDEPQLIEKTLISAANCADVVITSGGVSVGEADFIHSLLAKIGEVNFWKIEVKPGRPLAFGKLLTNQNESTHFFGLPGNPVSAVVSFLQFVQPGLVKLSGQFPHPQKIILKAKTTTALTCKNNQPLGKKQFLRAKINNQNGLIATSLENQSSGVLSSMSKANGFIVLAEDFCGCSVGAEVDVELFGEIIDD